VVEALPKTRSGKIMRRLLKAQTLGHDPGDTLDARDVDPVDLRSRLGTLKLKPHEEEPMSNKKPSRRVAVVPDEKTALNKEPAYADQRCWTPTGSATSRSPEPPSRLVRGRLPAGDRLAPALNANTFLGAPLGFWIAQNGAIYVFLLLIFIYAVRMNQIDKEFGVEE
jgi:putative solute:sodium symporter small subunit